MDGSEEDKETHTSTGDLPAQFPLTLFGCNRFSWSTRELIPFPDPGVVTGATLWAHIHFWKPDPVKPTDVAVEKGEVQPKGLL